MKAILKKIKNFIKKILFAISPTYRTSKFIYRKLELIERRVIEELRMLDRKYEMFFWYNLSDGDPSSTKEKKAFFKCFKCPSEELREKQICQAKMLKRIKDICQANGLVFWLEGGTLLGSIRHDGFIPWDDDIDICMLSEDLEKLKSIIEADNEFSFRNKYNYYLGCIVPGICSQDNNSCWVDIFPMKRTDCTCLGREETEKQINKYSKEMRAVLRKELVLPSNAEDEFIDMENSSDKRVAFIRETMGKFSSMVAAGHEPNCCYRSLTAHNSPGGCNLFFLDDVFPLTTAVFEGESYPVPKNYNLWLTTYYGDFYHVPLNRVPKHI